MSRKLKSPLKRYGGKTPLAPKLLPFIPKHHTYVELFFGAGALFFAKDVSNLEVINDLDSGIVNFFTVMQDEEKAERLIRLLALTLYSREVFELYRDTWQDSPDEVKRAQRFFGKIRMSWGSCGKNFSRSVTEGRNGIGNPVHAYLSAIDRLPEVHKRLRGVQIEHLDFRDIIEGYDRPDTFFYLDPPYVDSTRKTTNDYEHEMTDQDHEELVELLLGSKGQSNVVGL